MAHKARRHSAFKIKRFVPRNRWKFPRSSVATIPWGVYYRSKNFSLHFLYFVYMTHCCCRLVLWSFCIFLIYFLCLSWIYDLLANAVVSLLSQASLRKKKDAQCEISCRRAPTNNHVASVTTGILQIRWTDGGDRDVAALATMYIAEVPNESSVS